MLSTRRVRALCALMMLSALAAGPASAATRMAGTAPTITGLKDHTIDHVDRLGPILFTVGDDSTPADALTVSITSSNQAVVPDDNLVLGGSGSSRSLIAVPALGVETGTTTITVSVSDGTETTTTAFTLTVVFSIKYYLAEGATGSFFHTDILLSCPISGAGPTTANLTFLKEDGTSVQLPNQSCLQDQRETIHVDSIPGMESASFSTVIDVLPIGAPLAVERTMRWGASGYGAHTEKASLGPARDWFFAEGSQGFFFTYFLLVNPQPTANTAHVTYLREGLPPLTRDYPMLPLSRRTIGAGDDPELVNTSFGAHVAFDQPGMAERSMYFGMTPLFSGGTGSAGATEPSTHWLLAEGATGSYFTTFVLLANPGDQDAQATLTYLPASGPPIVKHVTVPAGQRITRNIAAEDPALESAAVGASVEADQPILVERSQYWPNPVPSWHEAHNSFGVTDAGTFWGLAEGGVGGPNNEQTYILLANPGATAADVTITFSVEFSPQNPRTAVTKHFTVPPSSRFNVAITGPGSDVPELVDQKFGATIRSSQPIVVERSYYYDADGVTWAAGTNATAALLTTTRPSVAIVGPDQVNVPVGTTVTLEGQGGPQFQWTLLKKPAGSQATLSDPAAANPTFVVDVEGDYLAQLIVGSGATASAPETVFVSTARPPIDVTVTATDANASEVGPDPGTFTFTRTGGDLTKPLTVNFAYLPGGAVGIAQSGLDFTDNGHHIVTSPDNARTMTIPANQTSIAVTVTPRRDSDASEGPEQATVSITPNRAYFVAGGTASITIADGPVVPFVSVAPFDESAQVPATFAISLFAPGQVDHDLALDFTLSGTAVEGVDYQPLPRPIIIPAFSNGVSIIITPIPHVPSQGSKTVTMTLIETPAYIVGSAPQTLRIIN